MAARGATRGGQAYSEDDIAYIRAHFGQVPARQIARKLGRTEHSIYNMARRLGVARRLERRIVWTPERDAVVLAEWGKTPRHELAKRLGCTVAAVNERASTLGATRPFRNPRRSWSPGEDRMLRELYGLIPPGVLASRIGRSEDAVRARAEKLALRAKVAQYDRYKRDKDTIGSLRIMLAGALEMVPADRVAAALGLSLADLPVVRAKEAVAGVRLVQASERQARERQTSEVA